MAQYLSRKFRESFDFFAGILIKKHENKTSLMKYIMKNYWVALVLIIIGTSTPAVAQIKTPSETRKQAKVELKDEQKKERERKKEEQKAKTETEKNNADFLDEKVSKKRKGKKSKPEKVSKSRGRV